MTAQYVVDAFLTTYPDCEDPLPILQDVYEEILQWVPLRQESLFLPLVATRNRASIDGKAAKVWGVVLWTGWKGLAILAPWTEGRLDDERPGWRYEPSGTPDVFAASADATGGEILLSVPALYGSLAVVGASNDSPIEIETASDHLLSTGDTVHIGGIEGNDAANGDFTATKTGDATFTLDGSAGSGDRTDGGYVAARNRWWFLEARASVADTLSLEDEPTAMPDVPKAPDVYSIGMCAIWAVRNKRFDEGQVYRAEFERLLSLQQRAADDRADGARRNVSTFTQNFTFPRRHGKIGRAVL